jgi:hypothetical protein
VFTVEFGFNYDRVGEECSTDVNQPYLQSSMTRKGFLFYQNTLGQYTSFSRAYKSTYPPRKYGESGWNPTFNTTDAWMGVYRYSEPDIILTPKINLYPDDVVTLKIIEPGIGDRNRAYAKDYITTTTHHGVSIILPEGLEFNNSVEIANANGLNEVSADEVNYNPGTRELTFRNNVNVDSKMQYHISVKAINETVTNNNIQIKHTFRSAITGGKTYVYGCYTKPVTYTILNSCAQIELADFSVERTTFGAKSQTDATPASKESGADVKVAGPYDNVKMNLKIAIRNSTVLEAGERLYAEIRYDGNNNVDRYYFSKDGGVELRYKPDGAADYAASVLIQPNDVAQGFVAGGKHSLKVNLAPYIGASKYIPSLNANDSVEVAFLTRTTESLPKIPAYIGNLEAQVYTDGGSSNKGCSPLGTVFRVVNTKLELPTVGNGNAAYYVNQNPAYYLAFRECIEYGTGSPGNYFPNEYRPNAQVSGIKIAFESLVNISEVLARHASLTTATYNILTQDQYSVTYENGGTIVRIDNDPTKEIAAFNQSDGFFYYVSWDAICWDSDYAYLSATTKHFPTSEEPKVEQITDNKVSIGLTVTNYEYGLTAINPTLYPTDNRLEWELILTNRSQWKNSDPNLPNSWIAVDMPEGVRAVELRDEDDNAIDTPIQYNGGYWWKMGTRSISDSKRYKLICEYEDCDATPELYVRYGMSKVAYPTDPYQGYIDYNTGLRCATEPVRLTFIPSVINFSANLVEQGAVNGKFTFCDPITFKATFTNALESKIYDPALAIVLPSNVLWVGNARVKLGNGAYENIPDASITQSGYIVTIDLSSKELDGYIYGIDNPNVEMEVEFQLNTTCNYANNTQVFARFIGHNGCGREAVVYANSGGIRIAGISAQLPDYTITVYEDQILPAILYPGSSGELTISGKITLSSATATPNDYIFIQLPNSNVGLKSSSADLTFSQQGDRLVAKLPDNAVFGNVSEFSVDLTLNNPEQWSCGEDIVNVILKYGTEVDMTCSNAPEGLCKIIEYGTKEETAIITIQKQYLSISDVTFTGSYNDANSETIVVNGTAINVSERIGSMRLALYLDNNNNGIFDAGDTPATGNPIINVANIPAKDQGIDGTLAFTGTFNIPGSEVCKLMLVAVSGTAENAYLCDHLAVKPTAISYTLAQPNLTVCQGTELTIGDLPIVGYTYSWNSVYITNNATSAQATFSYPMTETIESGPKTIAVPLTITRPGADPEGCKATTNVTIQVKKTPTLSSVPTVITCGDAEFSYRITSNVLGTTYTWVREVNGNITSIDPAIGNGEEIRKTLINTSFVPQLVKYTITMTSPDGCMNTAELIVTVNPEPILSSALTPDPICNGGEFTYSATSAVDNVSFSWERVDVNGNVTSANTSGAGADISDMLTGTSNDPEIVAYRISMAANGCLNTQDITVTVNPTVTVTLDPEEVCGGNTFTYTIQDGGISGTGFSWRREAVTGITEAAASGNTNTIQETLTNTTDAAIDVIYNIELVANGCKSIQTLTVTVNPAPVVSISNVTINEPDVAGDEADLTFTLTLTSCGLDHRVSVKSTTQDGTAIAPDDYTAKTEVIAFAAGEVEKTFSVKVKGDNILEGVENMFVQLSDANGCRISTTEGRGEGTINDRTLGDIIVEQIPVNAEESGVEGKFHIRFANQNVTPKRNVTITYQIVHDNVSPSDYTIDSTTTAIIPAGHNGVDIKVTPNDNYVVEGNERKITLIVTNVAMDPTP